MGAIVTVARNTTGTEAARLFNELGRWAEASSGVTFSPGEEAVELHFSGATDTLQARSYVEQVLGTASATWPIHLQVEVVSA